MKARRKAFTLIEALVVMALIGAALTALASAVYSLYRADRHLRQTLDRDRQVQRLTASFRTDAHAAVSATMVAETAEQSAQLKLADPDGRIVQYSRGPAGVDRSILQGSDVVARETFRLPAAYAATWQLDESLTPPLASLLIENSNAEPPRSLPRQAWRVDAAVSLIPHVPSTPDVARKPDGSE